MKSEKGTAGFFIGAIIGTAITAFVFVMISINDIEMTNKNWKNVCVEQGYAEYTVDSVGQVEFKWRSK